MVLLAGPFTNSYGFNSLMWMVVIGQILIFSPSVPSLDTEELGDITTSLTKSYLVRIWNQRTNYAGGLGCFLLDTAMKVVYFFPLVEKWWLCFLEAFLLAYSWNPTRVTSKEGSPLFLSQSQGWQRVRAGRAGGGAAQCSRWDKSWPKGRKDLKPKSTLWCAGPPSKKKHSPNTHRFIWIGIGDAVPRRLLKQRTDPLQWKAGTGAGKWSEEKDTSGRTVGSLPRESTLQVSLGWNYRLFLVWVVDGET